jgi:hypothetical protein
MPPYGVLEHEPKLLTLMTILEGIPCGRYANETQELHALDDFSHCHDGKLK